MTILSSRNASAQGQGKHVQAKDPLRSWTHRVPAGAFAAGVLSCALLGGAAYAAVSTDLFARAFGPNDKQVTDVWQVEDSQHEKTFTYPAMSKVAASPEEAQRQVGDYVTHVGKSATAEDFTVTVEDFLIDENGIGLMTYRLAYPEGIVTFDNGYGVFSIDHEMPFYNPQLLMGSNGYTDSRSVLNEGASGDAELAATLYFGPPYYFSAAVPGVVDYAGADYTVQLAHTTILDRDAVQPDPLTLGFDVQAEPLPARTMPEPLDLGDGVTALVSISPLGMAIQVCYDAEPEMVEGTFHLPGGTTQTMQLEKGASWDNVRYVTLVFADGSEFVVKGDMIMNEMFACVEDIDGGKAHYHVFNSLIDPAQVAMVILTNSSGDVAEIDFSKAK